MLKTARTEVWSGVTIKHMVSFAGLHLWFASFLPGFCRISAQEGIELHREREEWFPFGCVRGDSFAYLVVRPALGGDGAEFGARAYGIHGHRAATALVEQVQAWDRKARHRPDPTFAFWPTGSDLTRMPDGAVEFVKVHGRVTISWPAAA